MRPALLFCLFFLFINNAPLEIDLSNPTSVSLNRTAPEDKITIAKKLFAFEAYVESFYDCLHHNKLNKSVLADGLKGYYTLLADQKLANPNYLTLIDFTLPSNEKRFFVIDLVNKKIVFNSVIAHGRNSGGLNATKFSNEAESKMSSLGFYVTGAIYDGKYKYSMKIHGMEYSNSNAFERGVVVHSADYATQKFLKKNGNILGRSFGCPALPHKDYKKVVDTLKGGSCFFIHGKDRRYQRKSIYLKTASFIHSFYADFQP